MAKRKTVDISGMGNGYEATCQLMLSIGLEWIKDKPLDIWKGTGPTRARDTKTGTEIRFYGLMRTGKPIRELERIWSREIKDYTGAMHQAVLSHLCYIHKHGYEKWLEEVGGEDPERIYEIDTEQARRELDRHMAWVRANPEEAARQAFEKGKRIASGGERARQAKRKVKRGWVTEDLPSPKRLAKGDYWLVPEPPNERKRLLKKRKV